MSKTTCQAVLEMAKKIYQGEGDTLHEALKAIPLVDTDIKHKGTIKMTKDGKSFERHFPLMPLRRMFANKIYREHWAHQVEKFLK